MIHIDSYNPEKISYIPKLESGQWSRGEECKEKKTIQMEAPPPPFSGGKLWPWVWWGHWIQHWHWQPLDPFSVTWSTAFSTTSQRLLGYSFLVTRVCSFLFFLPHCVHVARLYLGGCPTTTSYFMSFPKRIIGSFESLFLIHPWQSPLYYFIKHAVVQQMNKKETEEWTKWRCSCRHL